MAGGDHSVTLRLEVVHLDHDLDPVGHRPDPGIDLFPRLERADANASTLHIDVGSLFVPTVSGELESEHADVEVNEPIEVGREQLESNLGPPRHRWKSKSPVSKAGLSRDWLHLDVTTPGFI